MSSSSSDGQAGDTRRTWVLRATEGCGPLGNTLIRFGRVEGPEPKPGEVLTVVEVGSPDAQGPVTDAEVEAGARGLATLTPAHAEWEDVSEVVRRIYRRQARAVLSAARQAAFGEGQ